MKTLSAILLLAALLPRAARADDDPQAVARIGAMVQAFQAAIIAKDGKALSAMFLARDNSWLVVAADPAGTPRMRASDYQRFADSVGTSKVPLEERFRNVRIFSNGSVGTVWFDFDFVADGKVTNTGSESWHLVHTDDGWKISSMIYSAR